MDQFDHASRISHELKQSDSVIADHAVWIAATAPERSLAVVTRNPRDFRRVMGLEVWGIEGRVSARRPVGAVDGGARLAGAAAGGALLFAAAGP